MIQYAGELNLLMNSLYTISARYVFLELGCTMNGDVFSMGDRFVFRVDITSVGCVVMLFDFYCSILFMVIFYIIKFYEGTSERLKSPEIK